jgi:hypothetical protein
MNRSFAVALIMAITGGGALGRAQRSPLSTEVKSDYQAVRDYFIKAAEEMPEAEYGFKPSPDVRTFGQQVAHVADDQYNLCVRPRVRPGRRRTGRSRIRCPPRPTWSPRSKRRSRIATVPTTR